MSTDGICGAGGIGRKSITTWCKKFFGVHGTKAFYIPGNHDEAARPFSGLHFGGAYVVNEIIHENADGKRMLVSHGDQFDAVVGYASWLAHLGDKAYDVALCVNCIFNKVRKRLGMP